MHPNNSSFPALLRPDDAASQTLLAAMPFIQLLFTLIACLLNLRFNSLLLRVILLRRTLHKARFAPVAAFSLIAVVRCALDALTHLLFVAGIPTDTPLCLVHGYLSTLASMLMFQLITMTTCLTAAHIRFPLQCRAHLTFRRILASILALSLLTSLLASIPLIRDEFSFGPRCFLTIQLLLYTLLCLIPTTTAYALIIHTISAHARLRRQLLQPTHPQSTSSHLELSRSALSILSLYTVTGSFYLLRVLIAKDILLIPDTTLRLALEFVLMLLHDSLPGIMGSFIFIRHNRSLREAIQLTYFRCLDRRQSSTRQSTRWVIDPSLKSPTMAAV